MPIYEYKCQQCGHVFEAIQKFSDPELTECRCEEQAPVKKLISAAAFHLKGSGWYVTDFRDKGKKKPGKDEGAEKPARSDDSGEEKKAASGEGSGESKKKEKENEKKESTSKPAAAAD